MGQFCYYFLSHEYMYGLPQPITFFFHVVSIIALGESMCMHAILELASKLVRTKILVRESVVGASW
jgi:hypothetical protein